MINFVNLQALQVLEEISFDYDKNNADEEDYFLDEPIWMESSPAPVLVSPVHTTVMSSPAQSCLVSPVCPAPVQVSPAPVLSCPYQLSHV